MPKTNKRKIKTKRRSRKMKRTREIKKRTKKMKGGAEYIPNTGEIPLEYFEDSGRLERIDSGLLDETNDPLVRTDPQQFISDFDGEEKGIRMDTEHLHMQLKYEIHNVVQEVNKLKSDMDKLKEENRIMKRILIEAELADNTL